MTSHHSHDDVVGVGLHLKPKDDFVKAVVEEVGGNVEHGAVPGGERAVDRDLIQLLGLACVGTGVNYQVNLVQPPRFVGRGRFRTLHVGDGLGRCNSVKNHLLKIVLENLTRVFVDEQFKPESRM